MAFGESWVIGIMLRFSGGQAMRGFQQLGMAARGAEGNLTKAQRALAKFDATTVAAGTRIAGAFALMGGAMTFFGVQQAAKFQLAMTTVGMSLGATKKQLEDLQNLAQEVSGRTAQSNVTIAQEMATASTAGLNTMGVGQFKKLFPLLAYYADVQQYIQKSLGRSLSPTEAVQQGVQMAHMFQAYDRPKMSNMLEWMTRFQMVTSESPNRALTQAKYFVPLGKMLGMNEGQIFGLLASMAQTAFLRGRGGTAIRAWFAGALNTATLTGHSGALRKSALIKLGLLSPDGTSTVETAAGQINWPAFLSKMSAAGASMKPTDFFRSLQAAFGSTGSPFASVFFSKDVQAQYQKIMALMMKWKTPIETFFGLLFQDFLPTFNKFVTNFVRIATDIFLPLLPEMQQDFSNWANKLSDFASWLEKHRDAAAILGRLVIALTGLSILRVGLGGLSALSGLPGLFRLMSLAKIGPLVLAFRALDNIVTAGMVGRMWALAKSFSGVAVQGATANTTMEAMYILFQRLVVVLLPVYAAFRAITDLFRIISNMAHGNNMSWWDTFRWGFGPIGALIPSHDPWGGAGKTKVPSFPNFAVPQSLWQGAPPPEIHVHQNIKLPPGTPASHAKKVVSMALDGIKSAIQSRGDTSFTNGTTPGILGMEGAPITHGLG